MDHQEAGPLPRRQETPSKRSDSIVPLAGHAPLPDGAEAGGKGVLAIRLAAPAPAEMEAENVAY
jgi:hypothetical protein